MPATEGVEPGAGSFRRMVRCRLSQLRNAIDQQLREAPLRTLSVLVLLVLIWFALYMLLDQILGHVRSWGLIGVVGQEHIFVHFFLVLAVMLAFSNAILTFGSLYGRDEAQYLLSLPIEPYSVVSVKWLEGMFLSSWSFLLLGVPLMMAVAKHTSVEWYYYPLFLAHFMGFIAIPACVGVLAACAVAMWLPRRPMAVAATFGVLILLVGIYAIATVSQSDLESEAWLKILVRHLGAVRQPLLPSTWTAKGIVAATNQDIQQSLFYLGVVVGNAAFLTWLTVNLLGRSWSEAYSRAQNGRFHPVIENAWFTATVCWLLFFYLPRKYRKLMLKDVKAFARDARQWSQMAIMFGLLLVYVLNLQRLPIDINNPQTKGLIAFLNLTTISLILATFTSRFVYPILSLESQQLWLLELLPVRRVTMLLIKFLFALTVTTLSAGVVMYLAVRVLDLPVLWARINLLVCLAVCIGLSGLSIGLGARFPVLSDRNPARIAAGVGGTFNLIASMVFVGLEMAGVAFLGARAFDAQGISTYAVDMSMTREMWQILYGLMSLAIVTAAGCLAIGARHFGRLEA